MPTDRHALRLLWLLPLLVPACRSPRESEGASARIDAMIARGRYEDAVREAQRVREVRGDDEEGRRLHKRASLAWLLQQGRILTFRDVDEEALRLFREAAVLAPESEEARLWIDKTRRKLGFRRLVAGDELHADGALEEALEAYNAALEYDPDLVSAREGAAQVLLIMNHREGLSGRYYIEGVRSLHDYFLQVARARFRYTQKYDDENERAEHREHEVIDLLSEERMAIARAFEDQGKWSAARNEYYIVRLMDPQHVEAREGYERTKVEALARRRMEEAKMSVLRQDFERARELLEEGLELAQIQDPLIEDALRNLEDQRIEALYRKALTLERDFQFAAAIATFQRILDERQWYKDARTRLSTLEETVARVERSYAEAAKTTDVELRRRKLREILIDWPDYRDVRDQLAALPPPPPPTSTPEADPDVEPGSPEDSDGD